MLVLAPLLGLAGAAWSLAGGSGAADVTLAGLEVAVAAFLGWALTRELAPDEEGLAFLGLAWAAMGSLTLGSQSIWVPTMALVAARLVNRSTGKAAEPVDTLLVPVGFVVAAWRATWILAPAGAVALALDAVLPAAPGQPARRRHAVAAAAVGVAAAFLGQRAGPPAVPPDALWTAPIALAGVVAVLVRRPPESVGDIDRVPLQAGRVRWGALLGIATVAFASADPAMAPRSLWASWGCVVAVAVAEAVRRTRGQRPRSRGGSTR